MAAAEMKDNPRYVWRGDRPGAEVRRLLGRARAMVLSSRSEGGANVISEAVAAGVPVLASRHSALQDRLAEGCGQGFAPGDAMELRRWVERLVAEPGLFKAKRLASSARAKLDRG